MYLKLRVRGLGFEMISCPEKWMQVFQTIQNMGEIYGVPFLQENAEFSVVEMLDLDRKNGETPHTKTNFVREYAWPTLSTFLYQHHKMIPMEPVCPDGEVCYRGPTAGQPDHKITLWKGRDFTALFGLDPVLRHSSLGRKDIRL